MMYIINKNIGYLALFMVHAVFFFLHRQWTSCVYCIYNHTITFIPLTKQDQRIERYIILPNVEFLGGFLQLHFISLQLLYFHYIFDSVYCAILEIKDFKLNKGLKANSGQQIKIPFQRGSLHCKW